MMDMILNKNSLLATTKSVASAASSSALICGKILTIFNHLCRVMVLSPDTHFQFAHTRVVIHPQKVSFDSQRFDFDLLRLDFDSPRLGLDSF